MKRFTPWFLLLAGLLITWPTTSPAAPPDPDRLRAEAEELIEMANDLRAEGAHEEAERRLDQSQRLLREAGEIASRRRESPFGRGIPLHEQREVKRREILEEMGSIERKIRELEEADRPEAVADLHHELRELTAELRELGGPPEPRREREPEDGPNRRIHLIEEAVELVHEAAERLDAADLPEPAEALHHQAEQLNEELRRRLHVEQVHRAIDELRREIERLHHALNELRGEVERL